MERRTLLAIFLAFIVLYTWQALFVKPVKPATPGSTTSAAGGATAIKPSTPPITPAAAAVAAVPPAAKSATVAASPVVADAGERDIRVETHDVIAVFTNRGARLKSWRLKHYLDPQGQPQELVERELPSEPLPFTLRTPDDAITATITNALFVVRGEPGSGEITKPIDLSFEYQDAAGVHAVKAFHMEPSSYVVTLRASVSAGDRALAAAVLSGPAVGDQGELTRGAQAAEGLLFQAGAATRLSVSDIGKQPSRDGDFHYAGVDDTYFLTAVLDPGPIRITYQPVTVPASPDGKIAARALVAYAVEPAKGDTPLKFFIGPKDIDVLSAVDRDAVSAINFGRFSLIVVPLLRSLKWVNSYVGNWGWSIVALTIILNIILFPLQQKSVVSMRKMQEIQPEIKAIQDRYSKLKATDPGKQKMNTEVMALYRERGVNPASGCVPLILTLPILYAMWAMFTTAIELRGAPFFWIHNLTARDPYYVTPVLMGATMFWQQRITPQTGDPAQQKMMMFMPIIMTAMFVSLPAGALIYYVVSNLWRIGQQYGTNYFMGPPNIRRGPGSPAERKLKRVGGGKTDAAATESDKP